MTRVRWQSTSETQVTPILVARCGYELAVDTLLGAEHRVSLSKAERTDGNLRAHMEMLSDGN